MTEALDLCSPCSHCGVCCTGTYALWFEAEGRRSDVTIDRPTLDEVLTRAFSPNAPQIVREWNAGVGWVDEPAGAPTDAGEFLTLLEHDDRTDPEAPRISRLAAFVRAARDAGVTLHIRYD